MIKGNNINTFTTKIWEGRELYFKRDIQQIESSVCGTYSISWNWNDPRNRHYGKVCRFLPEEKYDTENGHALSGVSRRCSLSTC